MDKEQLETNLAALKLLINEHNDKSTDYRNQVADLEKQLEDINKPELTPMQFDLIQEAIEEGVGNFDFSDTGKYDKEFGLDYDGRVMLDSLELNDTYELIDGIVERVHKLFTEAECSEGDDSQLNTQTVAEKII